jgi:hypothetical protein
LGRQAYSSSQRPVHRPSPFRSGPQAPLWLLSLADRGHWRIAGSTQSVGFP